MWMRHWVHLSTLAKHAVQTCSQLMENFKPEKWMEIRGSLLTTDKSKCDARDQSDKGMHSKDGL